MRNFRLLIVVGAVALGVFATGATAGSGGSSSEPQVVNDSNLKALSLTEGGASVLPTTRTIPHWWGSTTDPHDGITYGYNMVGADPNHCSGSACDVTVQVDITPIIVNVGGRTFDGNGVVDAVLHSPQFALNDYGTTPAATGADVLGAAHPAGQPGCSTAYGDVCAPRGAGGPLSQNDAGNLLQLQDATMRAQFNKTGSSNYHLRLEPHVTDPVTIDVPQNQGTLIVSGRGVVGGQVDYGWWSSHIKNLETKADPTHLPLYLTDNIFLYLGNIPGNCCVIGYHGTFSTGLGHGPGAGNGNQPVQTFAWSSYVQPGFYARANGGTDWALQDIHALSHEIAEWADDPFVNNWVEPWLTPTAPQYGCTNVLETGDPVVGIGFAMGTNTYFQNANPWVSPTDKTHTSISYDGYYHPEDEALLPWFLRLPPSATGSEPTQSNPAAGRYTFMGDLNPYPGFRQAATGC